MLYEFKSAAAGTVLMTEAVALRVLAIVGKSPAAQGILTEAQLPAALTALRTAINQERANPPPPPDDAAPEPPPEELPISLAQRAWPLLELLDAAQKAHQPVTWGV
jgi:hypothetical protein